MHMQDKLNIIKNLIRNNLAAVLAVLLLFTSGMNIYFYRALSDLRENPQKAVQEETKRMIARVGELITLPDNEQPTIATVSDPEKLKDQAFFAKDKIGDKVLIYANAGKSILYDPVADKVLEVASINVGSSPTPPPAGGSTPTPAPRKGR